MAELNLLQVADRKFFMLSFILVVALSNPISNIKNYYDHHEELMVGSVVANVAIGCMVGGVGSLFSNGTFKRGCMYGSLGGLNVAAGKLLATKSGEINGLGALSRLVGDFGNSIIISGYDNRRFDTFYTSIGPLYADIGFDGKIRLSASLLSTATVGYFAYYGKFDWRKSLYNATPIFRGSLDDTRGGVSGAGVVMYGPHDFLIPTIISHEMVHVLQWDNTRFLNESLKLGPLNIGQDAFSLLYNGGTNLFDDYAGSHNIYEIEAYGLVKQKGF